jgi:PAS domain-containing protein
MFTYDGFATALWHMHGIEPNVSFVPYAEHYHQDDVYRHGLIAQGLLRSGTVYNAERIVDATTLQRSAFINELMRPNGLGPICASPVHVPPEGPLAQLSFFRPVKAEEFGDAELNFLERMVPHFSRAARLRLRLEQGARAPAWTLELLDALPWGVILLDRKQRPIVVNREAERILAQADGLQLDRRGLYAEHPDDARRLGRMLAGAVAERGDGACSGADMHVRRPSGARPLLLTVVPLGRPSRTRARCRNSAPAGAPCRR